MAEPRRPSREAPPRGRGTERALLWREVRLLVVFAVAAAAVATFVLASGVFLLGFAAVLVAIVLRDASGWVAAKARLSPGASLAAVSATVLAAIAALAWLAAPSILEQAAQFAERMPQALDTLDTWLAGVLEGTFQLSVRDVLPSPDSLIGTLPNIVTTTFGALGSLVVIVAVSLYLAARPAVYREGVIRLFTPRLRPSVRGALHEAGTVLQRWLRGQLLAMAFVGVVSYVALRLLGVPLALGLALLSALLEFVPYIGPIVAAVPVALVASTESWMLAVYTLLVYTAIQMLEGYVLVPFIQQRAVFLPPAVIIFSQVLLGALLGVIGIIFATPLTAAAAAAVRRCYVRDFLEQDAIEEHDGGGAGGRR